MPTNDFGQPIGPPLDGWRPPTTAPSLDLTGRYVRLEPLVPSVHAPLLAPALAEAAADHWTYLPWGPIEGAEYLQAVLDRLASRPDWKLWAAFVDDDAVGFGAYLRIHLRDGVIEIGGLSFSPRLQRTPASTEIHAMLIANAFAAGFRRVEWKCDSLNAPSRRAAERLGFVEEGTFRKATHYRGRSRDTTWFGLTDDRWPIVKQGFDAWLDPANFDEDGRQLARLEQLRGE